MRFAAKTDIGKRAKNEDSYRIPPDGTERYPFFAVSDGMGGHAAGAVASSMIVKAIDKSCLSESDAPIDSADALSRAINRINCDVYEASLSHESLNGMGATLVCALFLDESHYIAANIGDSRLYQYAGESGTLTRVTTDHSLVEQLVLDGVITREQARTHPRRNIITRAMGVSAQTSADLFEHTWETGDYLVLCSDGLHGSVEDDAIAEALASDSTLEEKCDALVRMALENGGTDNITIVIVYQDGGETAC